MAKNSFDIYQTERGYVAITNDVRRQILEALAQEDRQLPELMEITGKAKPTLSSVHMKQLLADGLVTEAVHPEDSRKKVYTLAGRKIGSSSIPVEQLRSAVSDYVQISPLTAQFPLSVAFEALASAPEGTNGPVLETQAATLGAHAAHLFEAGEARDLLMAYVGFLEKHDIAEVVTIDLEEHTLALVPRNNLTDVPVRIAAAVLAGFLRGVLRARDVVGTVKVAEVDNERRRCTLRYRAS